VANAASGVSYGNSAFVATRGQARVEGGVLSGIDQDDGYPRIEESLDGTNVSNVIEIPQVVNPYQPAGKSAYPVNVRTQAPYVRFATKYTDGGTPTASLQVRVQVRPDGAFAT
jgi:hypothetical protein